MTLRLIKTPLQLVRNPAAVILWMSLPTLSVLLIRGAIAGVDVIYEEAAQTMGANWFQTFWRVTVPMAKKGIMGTLLLSISGSVGVYTLPLIIVGPNNNWLSTKIQREVNGNLWKRLHARFFCASILPKECPITTGFILSAGSHRSNP